MIGAYGEKVVIPDHKLYFIPVSTENEAAYLTGFLNAPTISNAVSAYGFQLSLGASVAEYLLIPPYCEKNLLMVSISEIARSITKKHGLIATGEIEMLNNQVHALLNI